MNILERDPRSHPELFDGGTAKSKYTINDLWNYYCLTFIESSIDVTPGITIDELTRRRQTFIKSFPKMSDHDHTVFNNLLSETGVEEILYAIDLMWEQYNTEDNKIPDPKYINNFLSDAITLNNSLTRFVINTDTGDMHE